MSAGRALVLALGCVGLAHPPARADTGMPASLITLGPWVVFCDNTGGCGLSNIAAHPGSSLTQEDIPSLCLWQGAPEADEAFFALRLDGAAGQLNESLLLQPVHGAAQMPLGPAVPARGDGAERYVIRGAALAPLVASMRTADALLVREGETTPVVARVALPRLDLALRAAQSRTKPYRPPATVPLRPFERIAANPPEAAGPLLREHCNEALTPDRQGEGFHLGNGLQLWSIRCRRAGFYNTMSLAMLLHSDGRTAPLTLPSVIDHEGIGPDLSNLTLTPETGIIEDFRKLGGAGDCGLRRRWGWTGSHVELLTEDYMPHCFGARSVQWLRLHRVKAADLAKPPC